MAYKRRTSEAIKQAQVRAANLEAISPTLDLGNSLTLTGADTALNTLKAKEKVLKTLTSRMLAAVGIVYGKDSDEYEQAGGTHTSEIARGSSSPAPTP